MESIDEVSGTRREEIGRFLAARRRKRRVTASGEAARERRDRRARSESGGELGLEFVVGDRASSSERIWERDSSWSSRSAMARSRLGFRDLVVGSV